MSSAGQSPGETEIHRSMDSVWKAGWQVSHRQPCQLCHGQVQSIDGSVMHWRLFPGKLGKLCEWKSLSRVWLFLTPWTIQTMEFSRPWNSPGQNTGVGSLSLLQGIFPTQGSNPGFPHCRRMLYQLSHKVSPRILEWVAYPFCRGSSWARNQTGVSCIAGGFFTNWATREALKRK